MSARDDVSSEEEEEDEVVDGRLRHLEKESKQKTLRTNLFNHNPKSVAPK